MMKERLPAILFIVLVLYIAFSLMIIVGPRPLAKTTVSRLYRTYLLPGPFFSPDRITDSYSFCFTRKTDHEWLTPVCPAKDNFALYHASGYPLYNYRNRLERSLYQGLLLKPDQSEPGIREAPEFQLLVQYLTDRYALPTDSVRLIFTRKRATHFIVRTDTLFNIGQP